MLAVSPAAQELSHLQTLRSLAAIDTAGDSTLDDLVRVAAHAFRCPIALISLVGAERQWFKASFGPMPPQGAANMSLCAQTLQYNDVYVVSDASLEPPLADLSLVGGPVGVRFYAGVPLRVDGHKVGTLCVLDHHPRTMDAEERTLLADLAHAAEHWFASRRRQMQVAQREREFRQLAEQMPGIVYRAALDDASSTLYVSPRVRELGFTPEQWMAQPDAWLQALHPQDRDRVLEDLSNGLECGEPFALQYRLRNAAGDWRHFEDVIRIVHPMDEEAPLIQGVMIDITDRIEVQKGREQLFLQLPDGVLIVDASHHILDANPQAERMLGCARSALLRRHIAQLMTGSDSDPIDEAALRLLARDPQVLEWDYRHPDGRVRSFEDTARTLEDGREIRVLRDVSRQRAEVSWLRKLALAAEQASEAIVITDLAANIEYVNQAAVVSSGYRREELIGRNSRILQSGLTPNTRYRKLWASLTDGKPWRGFFNNRRKDGSPYIEFAVISPVRGPDGRVTHYLAVKEDITEKRRMGEDLERYRHHLEELVAQRTDELELARRSAESASAAKSAFLATMSHEIRTPMNGVIGLADVLLRSHLKPHQKDLTETLRESAFALLSLIDDILDFSKIEAGRLVLERAPVALRRLVEKASDALQPVAAGRGVKLHVFVDPALPPQVLGDAARLRQIILNLVGNAIKFSAGLERKGRVALRVLPEPEGGVRLVVSDNGIGMSADVQARIFQPFVQGEITTTSHYGGTGLGLVISQRLVGAMGGRVGVESSSGAGATFTVDLPLMGLPANGEDVVHDLRGLHCHLALDDGELARDWAANLMAAGAQVDDWNGMLRAAGSAAAAGHPAHVLIVEAGRRDAGSDVLALPTVVVHHGLRGAPQRVAPGRVEIDSEGLHCDELLLAVAMAAGRAQGPAETGLEAGVSMAAQTVDPVLAAAQGRLILVAEDNEINQKVIRHQLDLLGLASEHVSNGQEALVRWRAGPDRYGVLLTDLHMPLLDGFALTAAIRQEEASGSRLPVIALTANVLGGEAARCEAAGMDGYLSKPVEIDRLRDTLTQWLPVTGLGGVSASARLQPPAGDQGLKAEFDDALLERLVGPDEEILLDLRRRYTTSLDAALVEIGAAVERADWLGAGMTAHRLRTSSCAIGAMELGRRFECVELAGRANDGAQMPRLVQALYGSAERVHDHFRLLALRRDARAVSLVLCVDDDSAQLRTLEGRLRAHGVSRIESFTSGAALLERLPQIDTTGVLLLLDLNMPQMDGMELIRHLAQRKFSGALALTSGADRRVLDTATRLAQAHHLWWVGNLHKPVAEEALGNLLQHCTRLARPDTTPAG